MNRIVSCFQSNNRNLPAHKLGSRYKMIHNNIKCIEKTFSSFMFTFLVRSFLEFFRIHSLFLNAVSIKFVITIVIYSCITLVVFISVMIYADILQNNLKQLCEIMLQSFVRDAGCRNGFTDLKSML